MENSSGIYTIEINNKLYVGSSNNLKHRLKVHKYQLLNNKHHNIHLQRSFNKYKEYKFEIIEYCTEDLVLSLEQYWINQLGVTNNKIGYNICTVSGTTKGFKCSEETKLKMSNSKKGIKFTNEHKLNIGLANKGRIITQESRNKISKTLLGRKIPREQVERTSKKLSKEVLQYQDTMLMNKFTSTKEAGRILNIDSSSIAKCARGEVKTAKGFTFKYNNNGC